MREVRCRPEQIFIYPEASPARDSAPIPKEFLSHRHTHSHPPPFPFRFRGTGRETQRATDRRHRDLEDGRWEGLHDANHNKGGPVGLRSREGRKHKTSVITGRDKTRAREVGKPWDNERPRVAPDSAEKVVSRTRATPRHAHRTRLSRHRPEMTDTHGGPALLADCLPLPPTLGALAEQRNQHRPNTPPHTPNTHTPHNPAAPPPTSPLYRHFRPPPTCLRQPASDGHFRFRQYLGIARRYFRLPPGPQALLLWGTTRKSAAPNSEFLGAKRAGAGLDGKEPSTPKSRRRRRPGDRTALACVALRMRTH